MNRSYLLGLTQTEQISDIWTEKSGIFHIFNPLNPPYQGDFKKQCVSPIYVMRVGFHNTRKLATRHRH